MSGTATLIRPNVTPIGERYILLPDGTRWEIPPHPLSGRIQPASELIPRVCLIPDYAFSSGPEAIELTASAGLALEPWEQLALILGLGETAAGKWAAYITALIVARQNGKGAILEALGLWWLFGTGEKLIGHTAHEYRTAMEAFRRIVFLIENTEWMRKKVKKIINTNGEEGIELVNGQRLRFLARSKGAGRGFTFNKLIWDEAYALTEEQQEAQLPTLSAVLNGQIWITSSPPLDSATGQPLFTLRRNSPTAKDVAFMDYGLTGSLDHLEDVDLDDQAGWLQANPNAPERISVETMARERAAMSDRGFARERLGIWPPDLSAGFMVISKEQWAALADPRSGSDEWPVLDDLLPHEAGVLVMDLALKMGGIKPSTALVGSPVISVAVAPRIAGHPRSSIGLAAKREDGKSHLELIKAGSGTAWLVQDAVRMCQLQTIRAIVIDPGSPAGSILGDLETALKEAGLKVEIIKMGARDVAQAFGMIYDAATSTTPEGRTIAHLGQEELEIAVGGADKRPVGDGHAWDSRNATVDITGLVSITHANWGLAKLGPEVKAKPMVIWA
jgi:hypothetical protein